MQEQRLRRPFPCIALTCQNVLPDVLPGRVSGAARLTEAAGPATAGTAFHLSGCIDCPVRHIRPVAMWSAWTPSASH